MRCARPIWSGVEGVTSSWTGARYSGSILRTIECNAARAKEVIGPEVRGDLTRAKNGVVMINGEIDSISAVRRQYYERFHVKTSNLPLTEPSVRLNSTNPSIRSPSSAPSELPLPLLDAVESPRLLLPLLGRNAGGSGAEED